MKKLLLFCIACLMMCILPSYSVIAQSDCESCNFRPGIIQEFSPSNDGCLRLFSNGESSVTYPCEIIDYIWTIEGGTITNEWSNGLFIEVIFDNSGTYDVCVETVIYNGIETCSEFDTVCIHVDVTDCGNQCCLPPDLDDITVNFTPPIHEVCVESDCPDDTEYRFRCREVTEPPSQWMDTQYITSNCVSEQFEDCKTYEIQVGYWTSECELTDLSESYFYTAPGDCNNQDCDNIELIYEGEDMLLFSLEGSCEQEPGRIFFQSEYREPDGTWEPFHNGIIEADYAYPAILNLAPCTKYGVRFRIKCDGVYGDWCEFEGMTDCPPCEGSLVKCRVKNITEARYAEADEPFSVNLYPNPATNQATFEIGALEEATAQITLTNSTGKTIRTYNEKLQTGTTQIQINELSKLPTGIYFYQIQVGQYVNYGKLLIQ